VVEVVREGRMPPGSYTRFGLHPAANLTRAERRRLADGLARTIAQDGGNGDDNHRGRGRRDSDD
jgi:hypothetical protein